MSELNIFQRMSAITAELRTVAKNLNVETSKGNGYKAVGEVDVLNAVKPLEEKYGVYSYPYEREIIESAMLESESTYNGKTTKKTTFFERIKTVYRFVNIDNPKDFIETVTFAEGIDSQDKGSGKAMTYSDKYALLKSYKISTGDDPDQNASEEVSYSKCKKDKIFERAAEENPKFDEKTMNNYVSVISKLLAETNTDGTKMLDFVNKNFGTSAQAFKDLDAQQLVFAMEKLRQKKEKNEHGNNL